MSQGKLKIGLCIMLYNFESFTYFFSLCNIKDYAFFNFLQILDHNN